MNIHMSKRLFVAAAVLGALAVFAAVFFVALAMRSAVAGPDSAPAGAPPNPGHTYDQIELPAGTWTGLDADLLDGLHASEIMGRPGFSRTTVDSAGEVGLHTSVTVGADGLPVISHYDWTNGDLKVAHCANAACTAGNTTTVDSGGDVGEYTSVTVGADGLPVISYWDSTSADLKVAHCSNAACTSSTTATVDSGGGVGRYTSVTVGADGLPVISYYDGTNHALKVAHCGNAACSAGNTITTVDSVGNAGLWTSVTVGADGLPLISYRVLMYGDLKVAHCGNAACTSSTTTTVDSVHNVGDYTSVTVGADGLPLISYQDAIDDDLKVAHCSNRFCVPYHRPR